MNPFMFVYFVAIAIYNKALILVDSTECYCSVGGNIVTHALFYGTTPGKYVAKPWRIALGNDVHIVSGCHFVNHDGCALLLRNDYPALEITKRINVGDNVYIGLNSTILAGTNSGSNVIIGAGSVVTRTVPDNSVAAGVPARVIKSLNDYLVQAQENSLGFGNLSAKDKEIALKKHFGVEV
jgi:acetyltransferase-like isoleucine patch superfamily enzyme